MNDEMFNMPPADWLVTFLLLGLWERDSYGHELVRRMPDLGFEAAHPGAVYRTLRQMEREGMISSEGDGLDGHLPRRRFSITGWGEAYLELWANALTRYEKEIDLFFDTYVEKPSRRAITKDGRGQVPLEDKWPATRLGRPYLRHRVLRCAQNR